MKLKKLAAAGFILAMTSMPLAFANNNIEYVQYTPPQNAYGYGSQYTNSANYNGNYGYQNTSETYMPPLYGRVVTVPAGAAIPAATTMELSTETLQPNQYIALTLHQPFYYNNTLIAPAGSTVNGNVAEVKNAKRTGRNARLRIVFTNITTPYGQTIPITGYIKTDDNTGTLVGGTAMDTTKAYAKDLAIGAGSGAVLGVIGAAVSGGAIGKGAALMTAVGAGAGLAKSLWDKGGEIVIPANSQVEIMLAQPATVSVQGN